MIVIIGSIFYCIMGLIIGGLLADGDSLFESALDAVILGAVWPLIVAMAVVEFAHE